MAALSLVFDLLGRDVSASKAFNDVGDSADRAGRKGEGFGSSISTAMKVAGGALLASGIVEGFKSFYDAAAESAKIGRLTENAIKSTGGAAKVTAKQVGDLVTAISNKTGVDDEAIQTGANLLLTFTNVRNEAGKGNDIFNQTTQIMTDMAAVLGTDASGSAIQLGKALNDPVKGVSALTKVGVSFTEQQKDQIKTLVESGDTLGAQKVILAELSKEFGGAAEAASTPFDKLKVNLGNLQETIGTALLPTIASFSSYAVDTLLPNLMNLGGYVGDKLGPVFDTVKDAVGGVYDLVVNGDFSGQLASAFNIQEDNPVVGFVLDARDSLLHAWDNLGNLWAGLDVSGLGTRIKDAAVAAGGDLLDGFKTGLDTGNWAPLGESIVGIIGSALSKIGELSGRLYEALKSLMGKVDWVGVGSEIGKQVPTMLAGLAIGLLNFDLGGLLGGLADHWFEALMAVLALALTPVKVVGKIGEALARIPLAGKFLEWGLNGLKGLTDNIVGWVGDVIGGFVRGFVGEGTRIGSAFGGIFETIRIQLFVWGDNVIGWFGALPGRFVQVAEALGSQLRAKFDEIMAYVGSIIRNGVDNVANFFSPVTSRLGAIAQSVWSTLTGVFNGMRDSVVGIFVGIRDTVGNVWNGLIDKVKSPIRIVFDFVNGSMIGPINSLLGKFPGGLQIPFLPKLAGGGLLRGPGTGTSDSILGLSAGGVPTAMVSNGEFVVNAAATKRNMALLQAINAGMPGFAGGGIVGSILGGIGNVAGNVVDFAKDIAEKGARKVAELVVNPLRNTAKGLIPGGNVIGDVVRGFVDKLADSVLGKSDEAQKATASFGGGSFGGMAAGGVQRWAGLVSQALSMLGQPQGLVQTVLRRMNQESGGNPGAINNWDINAKNGVPSKGLMQVIDPTFRANAMPGFASNIYDPLSNILASMRYAINRYGSLSAAYNKSGGYALGTDYVPATGSYVLHKGEAVVPAAANSGWTGGGPITLQLDGPAVRDLLDGRVVTVLAGVEQRMAGNPT
jgi:hypothetical protein